MQNPYCITDAQRAVLNQFTCERLSSNGANREQIYDFKCSMNPAIVYDLQHRGWESDRNGSVAYYAVKDPDGKIVMFFALKCGVMFDPSYFQAAKRLKKSDDAEAQMLPPQKQDIRRFIRYDKDEYKERKEELRELPVQKQQVIDDFWTMLDDEKEEYNSKMTRAKAAHGAIELMEFCLDDRAAESWDWSSMGSRKIGETLFWWFVVPKILEIGNVAGCEYVYTYVPDWKEDGPLMKYYQDVLHFRRGNAMGTFKSRYYTQCFSVYRRLHTLKPNMLDRDDHVEERDDLLGLDYFMEKFLKNFNHSRGGERK